MKANDMTRAVAVTALTFVFLMVVVEPAMAQTTTSTGGNIGTFVQNVINLLNNNVTRGLAILAIIGVGFTWTIGHLDLRRAATVILGIIVVFGAATIVDLITGASGS